MALRAEGGAGLDAACCRDPDGVVIFGRPYFQVFVQEQDSYRYVGQAVAGRLVRHDQAGNAKWGYTDWFTSGWVTEITLESGVRVEAKITSMPHRGDLLCVRLRTSAPLQLREYQAFGITPDGGLPDPCKVP